jgi:hypothetical protein
MLPLNPFHSTRSHSTLNRGGTLFRHSHPAPVAAGCFATATLPLFRHRVFSP